MNANELADKLDKLDTKIMIEGLSPNDLLSAELCDQSATMLRQQQAEIESHKKQLEACALLNYNKGHEDGRKLAIPSPVKEQLTDEELVTLMKVAQILLERFGDLTDERLAILRKASE